MTNELTSKRKADRAKMAAELEAIIKALGASVEVTPEGESRVWPQAWILNVAESHGLGVNIKIDGETTAPDIHVLGWHMHGNALLKLNQHFPGSVNPFHHRKCTTVCYGYDALRSHVVAVLSMAQDGTIFSFDGSNIPYGLSNAAPELLVALRGLAEAFGHNALDGQRIATPAWDRAFAVLDRTQSFVIEPHFKEEKRSALNPTPVPCGKADPSYRDCPNMKEVGGGFEGERYRCDVCGKGYFLDYEDMK